MKSNKRTLQVIKERWKYYLLGYIIGYLAQISNDGEMNIYNVFPIKLMGIVGALGIGTAFYYGAKKIPIFEATYRGLKYVVLIAGLFLVVLVIQLSVKALTGFDIMPFIGLSE